MRQYTALPNHEYKQSLTPSFMQLIEFYVLIKNIKLTQMTCCKEHLPVKLPI